FFMLETIREFGMELAAEAGETESLRRVHAAYFVQLAEQAEPQLVGKEQSHGLEQLEQEHDNLRATLEWTLGEGVGGVPAPRVQAFVVLDGSPDPNAERLTPIASLRLATALYWFWMLRGYLTEGRAWLERALQAQSAERPAQSALGTRARSDP